MKSACAWWIAWGPPSKPPKQRHRRNGDGAVSNDAEIGRLGHLPVPIGLAVVELEHAGVRVAVPLETQGDRLNGQGHATDVGIGRQNRGEIDAPKTSAGEWLVHELPNQFLQDRRGGLPSNMDLRPDGVRGGDGVKSENRGLSRSGHRTGIERVYARVGTPIDARYDEIDRHVEQLAHGKADAVRRGSVDGVDESESIVLDAVDVYRTVQADGVAAG